MMREKPWGKYLLWCALGLVIASLLAGVTVFFLVRSPAFQTRVLTALEQPLKQAGITYSFGKFSFDFLGDLHMEGLQLTVDRPPLVKGTLAFDGLRVSYAFLPLLQQKLVLKELELRGLRGSLVIVPPEPSPEDSPPFGPESALALLDQPPLEIETPEIRLGIDRLDVSLERPTDTTAVSIESSALTSQINWQKGQMDGRLGGEAKVGVNWSEKPSSLTQTPQTVLLQASSLVNIAWNCQKKDQDLTWTVEAKNLDLSLEELKAKLKNGSSLHVRAWSWEQSLLLTHEGPVGDGKSWSGLLTPLKAHTKQKQTLNEALWESSQGRLHLLGLEQTLGSELSGEDPATSWEAAEGDLSADLKLGAVRFQKPGDKEPWSLPYEFTLRSQLEKGTWKSQIQHRSPKVSSPLWPTRPLAWEQSLALQLELMQKTLNGQGSERINQRETSRWTIDLAHASPDALKTKLSFHLNNLSHLNGLHPSLKSLGNLGWPEMNGTLEAQLKSPKPLKDTTGAEFSQLTITNKLLVETKPSQMPEAKHVRWKELSLELNGSLLDAKLQQKGLLRWHKVQWPGAKQAVDGGDSFELELALGERSDGHFRHELKLGSQPLVKQSLVWFDKPELLSLKGEAQVQFFPEMIDLHPGLASLRDMGRPQMKLTHEVKLRHPHPSLKAWPSDFIPLQQDIDALLQVTVPASGKTKPYAWDKEIVLDTRFLAKKGEGKATVRLLTPQFRVQDKAQIRDLKWGSLVRWPSLMQPNVLRSKSVLEMREIEPEGELAVTAGPWKDFMKRFQVILDADLLPGQQLRLHKFYAGLQHPLLQIHADGTLSQAGEGAFDARVEAVMPEESKLGAKGQGRFVMPIQLKLYAARKISLEAQPSFEHLSLDWGDLQVRDLHGRLSLSEELTLDDKGRIGFLYLESQNPFVRVDFEEVEPYLPESSQLSFRKLKYKHLEMGPMVQSAEIRQNLVRMNQLKLDVLGGSALGRFYFDVHPSRLQAGFLGRFSELHPEFLKEKARQDPQRAKEVMTGRIALNFEVAKRLAVGRIDLTRLGRAQLLSLFDVLDPEFKDEQLASARKALMVAYPEALNLEMQQGLMDMTLDLGGAVSSTLRVRSLPLSSLIQAYAGEALNKLETALQAGKDAS